MTDSAWCSQAPLREYALHSSERAFLLFAYVAAAVMATYVCGVVQQCNNFHIFRSAFENLVAQRDLYAYAAAGRAVYGRRAVRLCKSQRSSAW